MASSARFPSPARSEIITLSSDADDDNYDSTDEGEILVANNSFLTNTDPEVARPDPNLLRGGQVFSISGEDIFIPDDIYPEWNFEPPVPAAQNEGIENEEFTAAICLGRVLEIFPDVNHDHVTNLYNDLKSHDVGAEDGQGRLSSQARLQNILEQLMGSTSYPKQDKGKKRKRAESVEADVSPWEAARQAPSAHSQHTTRAVLKADFPEIPVTYISEMLTAKKHLYPAYIGLAIARDSHSRDAPIYGKGRPSQVLTDALTIATSSLVPSLADELTAARQRVAAIRADNAMKRAKADAESENLRAAIESGDTTECSACYDDLPMNRQIHCNGPVAHFLCYECAHNYIKSEIGDARCRVLCTAGCGAPFPPNQLNLLADKKLLAKLAELEQEKAIRDAGLDDLEQCPFCDFKAILPPIEEDFEFRCLSPDCERVSCRRCKSISHIPMSCEEHAKENKISSRHKIEEAMTAAMVRSCNQCKKQFIKEYGCNKMRCSSCNNMQCYVCSVTLQDYDHFDHDPASMGGLDDAPGASKSTKCPLYDNVEERHEREVKKAEAEAREEVARDNPGLSVEDLQIKVSDAVKNAEADRIQRAGVHGGFHAREFAFAARPRARGARRPDEFDDGGNDEDGIPARNRPLPTRALGPERYGPRVHRAQLEAAIMEQQQQQFRRARLQERLREGQLRREARQRQAAQVAAEQRRMLLVQEPYQIHGNAQAANGAPPVPHVRQHGGIAAVQQYDDNPFRLPRPQYAAYVPHAPGPGPAAGANPQPRPNLQWADLIRRDENRNQPPVPGNDENWWLPAPPGFDPPERPIFNQDLGRQPAPPQDAAHQFVPDYPGIGHRQMGNVPGFPFDNDPSLYDPMNDPQQAGFPPYWMHDL
ncbi:Hypothetical protein R9X50_00748300 [Acrodontium crateriforme]|uniref:RING-type domain-containing protein n=1 Tax=Acrodontium crateriforme TaxID=150365 RepID=A0AAQ3RCA9_9PEZI|nr:Hypothetical protein R9X50_00748300 [Acrodontium crateriforme]